MAVAHGDALAGRAERKPQFQVAHLPDILDHVPNPLIARSLARIVQVAGEQGLRVEVLCRVLDQPPEVRMMLVNHQVARLPEERQALEVAGHPALEWPEGELPAVATVDPLGE